MGDDANFPLDSSSNNDHWGGAQELIVLYE
jgi:hypothetical protein